jgi:hypothetical protein
MIKEEMFPQDMPSSRKNFMWPILFIFIAAAALLVGIFLYKQGAFSNIVKIATPSPTPTLTSVPAKEAVVDLTKYEIEIQNGSEVSGEAGRQQTSLEEEGFVVSSIGNADNSDFTDTIIQAKTEVDKAFITKLKTVLSDSFTVTTETLATDSSVPVIVIIGTKK